MFTNACKWTYVYTVVSNNYVSCGCSPFSRPHLHLVALLVVMSGSKEPHNILQIGLLKLRLNR